MAGAFGLALAAAGCGETGCHLYCSRREDPTAAQAKGFREASLKPRVGAARRKLGGGEVASLAVNAYGQLTVSRDKKWIYTSTVDGKP